MHTDFKVSTDKVDSRNFPEFKPEEIDILINLAIERFIHQRAYGNNPRKEGLEETQKRFDDLLTLITPAIITAFTTPTGTKPNGQVAALPTDYWHMVQEDATITYTDCNSVVQTVVVPIIPITHERYNKVIRDPFNKPTEKKVIRIGQTSDVELIRGAGTTLTAYNFRYIRRPASVRYGTTYSVPTTDVNCDLPDHTHREIIQLARSLALGIIESKSVQVSDKDTITQE